MTKVKYRIFVFLNFTTTGQNYDKSLIWPWQFQPRCYHKKGVCNHAKFVVWTEAWEEEIGNRMELWTSLSSSTSKNIWVSIAWQWSHIWHSQGCSLQEEMWFGNECLVQCSWIRGEWSYLKIVSLIQKSQQTEEIQIMHPEPGSDRDRD